MPSVQSSSASAGSPGADGVLIVGGGQAAVHLASALRDLGWQSAVTIVSEESYAPYQRPPLSKAFLSGNAQPTTLEFRSAERYGRDRITVVPEHRATQEEDTERVRVRPHPFRLLLLFLDERERPGRTAADGGPYRLFRVALGVGDDRDRLVVLVERVRCVPAALPGPHAQAPVDAYLTVRGSGHGAQSFTVKSMCRVAMPWNMCVGR